MRGLILIQLLVWCSSANGQASNPDNINIKLTGDRDWVIQEAARLCAELGGHPVFKNLYTQHGDFFFSCDSMEAFPCAPAGTAYTNILNDGSKLFFDIHNKIIGGESAPTDSDTEHPL